jgi:hypothetical protein
VSFLTSRRVKRDQVIAFIEAAKENLLATV